MLVAIVTVAVLTLSPADRTALCAEARAIWHEAGRNERAAERLARARGHSWRAIAAAKRFCRRPESS